MFKKIFTAAASAAVLGATIVSSPSVFAADPTSTLGSADLTKIAGDIDMSTVGAGILAIAGMLAAVYALQRGVKMVLGFIRS